jgi:hypothetical protein
VKTYVRAAYRKIGVTSRTQAVRWMLLHPELLAGANEDEPHGPPEGHDSPA